MNTTTSSTSSNATFSVNEIYSQWMLQSALSPAEQKKIQTIQSEIAATTNFYSLFSTFSGPSLDDDELNYGNNINTTTTNNESSSSQKQDNNPESSSITSSSSKDDEIQEDKKIETLVEFYTWFEDIENIQQVSQLNKYKSYQTQLETMKQVCEQVWAELGYGIQYLNNLEKEYIVVSTKTGELHKSCQELGNEQVQLEVLLTTLNHKLDYFNQYHQLLSNLHTLKSTLPIPSPSTLLTPSFSLTPWFPLLSSSFTILSSLLQFLTTHPSLLSLSQWKLQFTFLHTQYLNLLTSMLTGIFTSLPTPPQSPLKDNNSLTHHLQGLSLCKKLSGILKLYVNNAHTPPPLLGLWRGIRSKKHLNYNWREIVQELHIHSSELWRIMRGIGEGLLRTLLIYEYEIWEGWWGGGQGGQWGGEYVEGVREGMGRGLWEYVRPLIIAERKMEGLAMVIGVVKEIGGLDSTTSSSLSSIRSISTNSSTGSSGGGNKAGMIVKYAMTSLMIPILCDCQERLIYLAQRFIKEEIESFSPSNTSNTNKEEKKEWWGSVEKGLECVRNLYMSVDVKIFESLAYEVVEGCIHNLTKWKHSSYRKRLPIPPLTPPSSSTPSSTPAVALDKKEEKLRIEIEDELWMIHNLGVLKEQLAPLKLNFVQFEVVLDFSNLKDYLHRYWEKEQNQIRHEVIITTSTSSSSSPSSSPSPIIASSPSSSPSSSSMVASHHDDHFRKGFIEAATPHLKENRNDSRKDLDNELIKSQKQLILILMKDQTELLASWITRANAFLNSNKPPPPSSPSSPSSSPTNNNNTTTTSTTPTPTTTAVIVKELKEQGFGKVENVIQQVIEPSWGSSGHKLKVRIEPIEVYLNNVYTRVYYVYIMTMLRDNLMQCWTELLKIVEENYNLEQFEQLKVVDPRSQILELFNSYLTKTNNNNNAKK